MPDLIVYMNFQTESLRKEIYESYAKKLASYNTKYFTCHCTGTQQFEILKSIMKEKVEYISTGNVINIF